MSYSKEIANAILNAMKGFNASVKYTPGNQVMSGFHTVNINGNWNWDEIGNAINNVCKNYSLYVDNQSTGSFDLNELF